MYSWVIIYVCVLGSSSIHWLTKHACVNFRLYLLLFLIAKHSKSDQLTLVAPLKLLAVPRASAQAGRYLNCPKGEHGLHQNWVKVQIAACIIYSQAVLIYAVNYNNVA